MPALWRPRRVLLCAGLVLAGIIQASGAIILSVSSATLLKSEGSLYGLPVLGVFALSAVVVLSLFVAQQKYAEEFALSYVHEVRMAYARHALLVPFDVKSPGLGLSLTRLVNDLGAVKLWLSRGLLALIAVVPITATLGVWILVFEGTMFLPLLAAGLVWCISVAATLPGLRHSIRKARQHRGGLSLLLGRTLPQRLPLLLHGKLEPLLARLAKRSTETSRYLTLRAVWSAVLKAGSRASFPVAVAVYAFDAEFDADRIVLFLMVFSFWATQLEAGASGIEYFQANKVGREKLMKVFSLPALETEPVLFSEGISPQAFLQIDQLRLPSGRLLTRQIEQGSCTTIHIDDTQDLRHLALSLAGLTDTASRDCLSHNGKTYAMLGCKEIWRHIALIDPENGIPDYQKKRPPIAFGNRGMPSEVSLQELSALFGDWSNDNGQTAEHHSEEAKAAIRVTRAFLRSPSTIVIADSTVLNEPEWMVGIRDLAGRAGITLVCLARSDNGIQKTCISATDPKVLPCPDHG